jgi:tetratricopeptide (TPR) repeat protein
MLELDLFVEHTRNRVRTMIAGGETAKAVELMTRLMDIEPPEDLMRDYAFLISRHADWEKVLGAWEKRSEEIRRRDRDAYNGAARIVEWTYRLRGDLPRAIAALDRYVDKAQGARALAGDWARIAKPEDDDMLDGAGPGLEIIRHELAGRTGSVAGRARAYVANPPEAEEGMKTILALIYCGRPVEAAKIAAHEPGHVVAGMEILYSAGNWKEAAAIHEKAPRGEQTDRFMLDLLRARGEYRYGDKKKAIERFGKLEKEAEEDTLEKFQLVRILADVGEKAWVDRILAEHPDRPDEEVSLSVLVEMAYGEDSCAPDWLRAVKRAYPAAKVEAQLATLRAVLEKTADAATVQAVHKAAVAIALEELEKDEDGDPYPATMQWDELNRLGEIDLARKTLRRRVEEAETPVAALIVAGVDADSIGELEVAEKYLRRAQKSDAGDALVAYHLGRVVEKRGNKEEGARLRERAELLALAETGKRMDLAEAMAKAGELTGAVNQIRLALRGEDHGIGYVRAHAAGKILMDAKCPQDALRLWQWTAENWLREAEEFEDDPRVQITQAVEIRCALADAYEALKDFPAALRELEAARMIDADNKAVAARVAKFKAASTRGAE